MQALPFSVVKRDGLVPLCPHCGEGLSEVYMKSRGAGFVEGKNVIYFCLHCLTTLGSGQSRMI